MLKSKWNALFCADLHLMSSSPQCRVDDFIQTQFSKWNWIQNLAKKYDIPIFVAGDFGDKPKWGDTFLELAMDYIDKDVEIYVIPGQHDLPNHSLRLYKGSALSVLEKDGYLKVLFEPKIINDTFTVYPFPYGVDIKNRVISDKPMVAITHEMVINKPLWPGQIATKAVTLLKKFNYDVILSGDNHKPFKVTHYAESLNKIKILVNPGSVTRTEIGQVKHKPRVYLWNSKRNITKKVFIPIADAKDVMSRAKSSTSKSDRKKFISNFINKLEKGINIKRMFKLNLQNKIKMNNVSKTITKIIWENVDD